MGELGSTAVCCMSAQLCAVCLAQRMPAGREAPKLLEFSPVVQRVQPGVQAGRAGWDRQIPARTAASQRCTAAGFGLEGADRQGWELRAQGR